MVQVNFALREVNCKIVYYGPGRSGKTTNLEKVHEKAPKDSIGELVSIATETDRTLYFDFLPLNLGSVAGMATKFQLYTVPGQVYYNATRKLVLQGADGVVFVADSQKSMREENIESLKNLADNMKELGMDIGKIPLALQWNKRDLPDIMTPEEMNADMNQWGAPCFEAIAITGEGVFPTLKAIASVVIKRLNEERGGAGTKRPGISARPSLAGSEVKPKSEEPTPPKPEPAPAPSIQPHVEEPVPVVHKAPTPAPVEERPAPVVPEPVPVEPVSHLTPVVEDYTKIDTKPEAPQAPQPSQEPVPVAVHASEPKEESKPDNPFMRELAKKKHHDEDVVVHKPAPKSVQKKKWWQFWK